jgi:hypothetical protein
VPRDAPDVEVASTGSSSSLRITPTSRFFGDAEWTGIFTAEENRGSLAPGQQGLIDVPHIRTQVADILEGVRAAFMQRKEKYDFWPKRKSMDGRCTVCRSEGDALWAAASACRERLINARRRHAFRVVPSDARDGAAGVPMITDASGHAGHLGTGLGA